MIATNLVLSPSDTDMKLHMMGKGYTSWEVELPGQPIP